MKPQETLAELVRINSVSVRSNADIVAYLLRVSRMPAGPEELGTNLAMLAQICITKPTAGR